MSFFYKTFEMLADNYVKNMFVGLRAYLFGEKS